MELFFFLVVAAMVTGAVLLLQFRARQARIGGVVALARRAGFTFTAKDIDHLVDLPFALFSKGDRRCIELVVSGTHAGLPMRMFDYWYYDEESNGRGGRSRNYHRFTCALVTIPAACPRLRLGHEDLLTRLGDHVGLRDVELEYDDFNRRFEVKCDDQKFAFSLLDGKMMQWLLGADDFDSVEVNGPWVLLARSKLDPSRWLDLGSWLDRFHRQIPPVVYSTYPPR